MLHSKTLSFWDFVETNSNHFVNADYSADNSVLYADVTLPAIQLWAEYYTRYNGKESIPSGVEMMPHNFVVNIKT